MQSKVINTAKKIGTKNTMKDSFYSNIERLPHKELNAAIKTHFSDEIKL